METHDDLQKVRKLISNASRKRKRSRTLTISSRSSSVCSIPSAIFTKNSHNVAKRKRKKLRHKNLHKKSCRSSSDNIAMMKKFHSDCNCVVESRRQVDEENSSSLSRVIKQEKFDDYSLMSNNEISFIKVPTSQNVMREIKREIKQEDDASTEDIVHDSCVVVHEKLCREWSKIIKNGLPEEIRDELAAEYRLTENYEFLRAPKLNPQLEYSAAAKYVKSDESKACMQNRLSYALVAIDRVLSSMLNPKDDNKTLIDNVETLVDAGRILSDIHHNASIKRRRDFASAFDLTDIADMSDVSEFLFGEQFSMIFQSAKLPGQIREKESTSDVETKEKNVTGDMLKKIISNGRKCTEEAMKEEKNCENEKNGEKKEEKNCEKEKNVVKKEEKTCEKENNGEKREEKNVEKENNREKKEEKISEKDKNGEKKEENPEKEKNGEKKEENPEKDKNGEKKEENHEKGKNGEKKEEKNSEKERDEERKKDTNSGEKKEEKNSAKKKEEQEKNSVIERIEEKNKKNMEEEKIGKRMEKENLKDDKKEEKPAKIQATERPELINLDDIILVLRPELQRITEGLTSLHEKITEDRKPKLEIKAAKGPGLDEPFPGIEEVTRRAYLARGTFEGAIPHILNSHAKTTMKGYERPVRFWWEFCKKHNIDVYNGTIRNVLQFFVEHEDYISSINVLNTWRSALGDFTIDDLGKDKTISNYVKGFASQKCKIEKK